MVPFFIAILMGLSLNSYNTGGVDSASEAFSDIKSGIEEGYSKDEFTSYKLND